MGGILDRHTSCAYRHGPSSGGLVHRSLQRLDVLLLYVAEAEVLGLEEFIHACCVVLLSSGPQWCHDFTHP